MNLKRGSTPGCSIFLLQWLWAGCAGATARYHAAGEIPVVLVGTYLKPPTARFRFVRRVCGGRWLACRDQRPCHRAAATRCGCRPWWCRCAQAQVPGRCARPGAGKQPEQDLALLQIDGPAVCRAPSGRPTGCAGRNFAFGGGFRSVGCWAGPPSPTGPSYRPLPPPPPSRPASRVGRRINPQQCQTRQAACSAWTLTATQKQQQAAP